MSAKNDDKIYDSIRDFGIKIIKKKNEKKADGSTTSSNTPTNQKTTGSKPQPSNEPTKSVHINNQK